MRSKGSMTIRPSTDGNYKRPLLRAWMVADLSRKFDPYLGDLYETKEDADVRGRLRRARGDGADGTQDAGDADARLHESSSRKTCTRGRLGNLGPIGKIGEQHGNC